MDGLTLLTNGSAVDKLRFLFQVYDMDGKATELEIGKYKHCGASAHAMFTHARSSRS